MKLERSSKRLVYTSALSNISETRNAGNAALTPPSVRDAHDVDDVAASRIPRGGREIEQGKDTQTFQRRPTSVAILKQ